MVCFFENGQPGRANFAKFKKVGEITWENDIMKSQEQKVKEEVKKLARQQTELLHDAYKAYLPLVENMLATQTTDVKRIEELLDSMLSFCFDHKMLLLYRRLCRHLFGLNPKTAAWHITAYREMWDEEGKMFGNNKAGNL